MFHTHNIVTWIHLSKKQSVIINDLEFEIKLNTIILCVFYKYKDPSHQYIYATIARCLN